MHIERHKELAAVLSLPVIKEVLAITCLSVISTNEVREQEKGPEQISAKWKGKSV